MDIKKALMDKQSKAQVVKISNYIGADKKRFARLMDLFFGDDLRISQRASWVLSHCVDKYPALIMPYLEKMINQVDQAKHNAIKRNTVRIMADIELPEELLGIAADVCFRFLDNPQEAIAVRVFSMSVCYNITLKEPALANELRLIIEDHYEHGSAGFQSRARRILKALKSLEA